MSLILKGEESYSRPGEGGQMKRSFEVRVSLEGPRLPAAGRGAEAKRGGRGRPALHRKDAASPLPRRPLWPQERATPSRPLSGTFCGCGRGRGLLKGPSFKGEVPPGAGQCEQGWGKEPACPPQPPAGPLWGSCEGHAPCPSPALHSGLGLASSRACSVARCGPRAHGSPSHTHTGPARTSHRPSARMNLHGPR